MCSRGWVYRLAKNNEVWPSAAQITGKISENNILLFFFNILSVLAFNSCKATKTQGKCPLKIWMRRNDQFSKESDDGTLCWAFNGTASSLKYREKVCTAWLFAHSNSCLPFNRILDFVHTEWGFTVFYLFFSKVYVQFYNEFWKNPEKPIGKFFTTSKIPGKIHPSVYGALKLRQLKIPIKLDLLP